MGSGVAKAIRRWFLTPEAGVQSQVSSYGTRGERSDAGVGSPPSFCGFTLLKIIPQLFHTNLSLPSEAAYCGDLLQSLRACAQLFVRES
jgi:hypothetical protein